MSDGIVNPFWSAVVVTAANEKQAAIFEKELLSRQQRGAIPAETAILTVSDPVDVRIGSGGATLNAILASAETLSARAGFSVIDPDTVCASRVLIIHSGGDSQRIPQASVYGKAFTSLPVADESGELLAPIDLLYRDLTRVCASAEKGIFIASCDIIMHLPDARFDWSNRGVTGLAIPADAAAYGTRHGVYKLAPQSDTVESFFQKASVEHLKKNGAVRGDGNVLLDSGVVYFSAEAVELLLSLLVTPPLDACTYLGMDSGARPMRLELYSDILACMAESTDYDDYLKMASDEKNPDYLLKARKLLWKTLRGVPFHAVTSNDGHFIHLGTTKEFIDFFVSDSDVRKKTGFGMIAESYWSGDAAIAPKAILMNSILEGGGAVGDESIVENSRLTGNWRVGSRAFCSGIRSFPDLQVKDGMIAQELPLRIQHDSDISKALTLFSISDDIKKQYTDPSATVCGKPWSFLLDDLDIGADEIWRGIDEVHRTLWNARLYPILGEQDSPDCILWLQEDKTPSKTIVQKWLKMDRLSFQDLLRLASTERIRDWKLQLGYEIKERRIRDTLAQRRHDYLQPLLTSCAHHNRWEILNTLDEIAANSSIDIVARAFAVTADCLSTFAGKGGGLRSGPAQNPGWREGYDALNNDHVASAVRVFTRQRGEWQNSPRSLVRAARHYEGAAQILIQKTVATAPVKIERTDSYPPGAVIEAEIPARIDLAGGWTDTPPITYEFGGSVINMAITIDGGYPLRVKATRIADPQFVFRLEGLDQVVTCRTVEDFADYNHPLAPGALLKAAVLCTGIVDLHSTQSLKEQLAPFGGGLEVQSWCNLPMGSGLGTSSILGGAVLAVIGKAMGCNYDNTSLIHAVLLLEQMMTTGGGWQDQVGGILPGVKRTDSSTSIPFSVKPVEMNVSGAFAEELNKHLVLIFTGRTRLARNLLQDVVRRWYARVPDMLSLVNELRENTDDLQRAFETEDLDRIGACVNRYWDQKKRVAAGVEPSHIKKLIDLFRPHVRGATLTGAGGGGFLFMLAKDPQSRETVRDILQNQWKDRNVTMHEIALDRSGLSMKLPK